MIYSKLCKKLKFEHTAKWYMHKPESVLEKEANKILWDFVIQTDHLIPPKRPDLVVFNKKKENFSSSGFCYSDEQRRENKK